MAVADDEAVAVHVGGEHSVEFGFRTCFKPKVILLAVADDFFHHGAHLVHLYRINDKVLGLEIILLFGTGEALGGFLDTVVENVRKS